MSENINENICRCLLHHGKCQVPFEWMKHRLGERWGFNGQKELYVRDKKFFGKINGMDVRGTVEILPNYDFLIHRIDH